MALGRPRQSPTFGVGKDRKARFSGIADNLSICEECQHMNIHRKTQGDKM